MDEIEKSLEKKFQKTIYKKFIRALNIYKLINEGDKVAVCISGGKDSFLLAKCLDMYKKHSLIKFDTVNIVMDPGYNKEVIDQIKKTAKDMKLDIKIYNSDIFMVSNKLNPSRPCYMCARMRRGFLYKTAEDLGCNVIALGHHFDDVIETTLLSLFYNGEFKTMMPKLNSTNFQNMRLIRPLYLVKEEDIIKFRDYHKLTFTNCACPYLNSDNYEDSSKRLEIKNFIKDYKKINPNIDINIFRSLEKVNLKTIISYKEDEEVKSTIDIKLD